jgi:hypothetical protein
MARVPIRPDTERSSEPTAEIIDETISGRMRHLSIRKNKSPNQRGKEIISIEVMIKYSSYSTSDIFIDLV